MCSEEEMASLAEPGQLVFDATDQSITNGPDWVRQKHLWLIGCFVGVQMDLLMELLGYRKVGWVFSQSAKERDYILNSEEVRKMAAMQVCGVGVGGMQHVLGGRVVAERRLHARSG